MLDIIMRYLDDTLSIDDELLKKLNEYPYTNDAKNYCLIPIVLYILKSGL